MALDGTYGGLKASVASWLKRTDLTGDIPDLVRLAEARIARDMRLRAQITFGTLTCSTTLPYVTLPDDFLECENITVTSGGVDHNLTYETPEQLDARFPNGSYTGTPAAYSIIGARMYLGPAPDSAYVLTFTYYSRFTALSADADTNWLLTQHPSIYLFATLSEAGIFLVNDERVPLFDAKYQADSNALQNSDDESLRSGSVMRVRTV